MGTKHNVDQELWQSLEILADHSERSPSWRFGKYVDPIVTAKEMRLTREGRETLIKRSLESNGRIRERTSDVSPFIAWDGEGITYKEGQPQQYVLFGSSTGHFVQKESLDTLTCLECILQCGTDNPGSIHVGFAFKYDAEMILSDLEVKHWIMLRKNSAVNWNGYRITYHPGRLFGVSKWNGSKRTTVTIYDVWGFFQGSFVNALRTWLDSSELTEIEKIETGKKARGSFLYSQIEDFITPYWQTELRLLVILCSRLRESLYSVGLCPSRWHGAGALATKVYSKNATRKHQSRTSIDWKTSDKDITTILPEEVNHKARFAYTGGRFELFRLGHYDGTVYQYDINSAYPNGISKLPSLSHSEWEYKTSPSFDPSLFALWHVEYLDEDSYSLFRPGPLPYRDYSGRVSFPHKINGWYWTPEVSLIANNPCAKITEVWICHHNDDYPFTWVEEMYEERRARKRAGDPSEKALKLALNSLY